MVTEGLRRGQELRAQAIGGSDGMNQKRATLARRGAWRRPAPWETVCRRASGRRRYNSWRQLRAAMRRREVERLLAGKGSGLFA
jgi:hypothetical protein